MSFIINPYIFGESLGTITFIDENSDTEFSSSTIEVTKPTGTQEYDLLVASISTGGVDVTTLSGWTLVDDANESGNSRTKYFYKVAGNSEPATYTWSFASSSASIISMAAFRANNATTWNLVDTADDDVGPTNTITVGNIDTTSGNIIMLGIGIGSATSPPISSDPSGMTTLRKVTNSSTIAAAHYYQLKNADTNVNKTVGTTATDYITGVICSFKPEL